MDWWEPLKTKREIRRTPQNQNEENQKNENKSFSKKLSYDRNLNLNMAGKKHLCVCFSKIILYFIMVDQQTQVVKLMSGSV